MRLVNETTGVVLEVPMPDELGQSAVLLNGQVVERVLFSDVGGSLITLGDGTMVNSQEFVEYVSATLVSGEWLKGDQQ